MSLFSRKSKLDREFDLRAEICRLTDRVASLERTVGISSFPRTLFFVGSYGRILPEPPMKDCIATITDHLGIEIVSNPESHAKWVARKVGAKK